jgi:hypothetical protein
MELLIVRRKKTTLSTIGDLYIDGKKRYVTLEDTDRGLTNEMTLEQIKAIKVKTTTAIPTGRYKLSIYNSPKHGKVLLVNNVPGFDMIEIHVGNYPKDTDGCTLVGMSVSSQPDMINSSKDAIAALNGLVMPFIEGGGEAWATYV